MEIAESYYGRDVPLSELVVLDVRVYTLMVVFTIIAGSGLLVINNIQAVAQAAHQKPSSFFVTLVSLSNASGRVLAGVVADWLRKHNLCSRLQLLAFTAFCMAAAQATLSFGTAELLYPCLLVVGFMFGSAFSNVSAVVADLWGVKYIGSNYGFVDLSPIFGSYIFSTGLITAFYPSDGGDDDGGGGGSNDDDDEASCVGAHCFRTAFLITTSCGLLATALCYTLHIYTPMVARRKTSSSTKYERTSGAEQLTEDDKHDSSQEIIA